MPKNIVILLDGTANQISAKRTNVLRLYGCLHQDARQLVYYDPGVGTLGAKDATNEILQKTREVIGMATGYGMDRNIKDAYQFIVENAERPDANGDGGDNIYIFGFSRGAYSARVLAGFIHALGLIEPRHLNLLDYAYRGYKRISIREEKRLVEEFTHYDRVLQPRRSAIRLLGLFDTVASILEVRRLGLRLKTHAYTDRNPSVRAVRQALALDERRTMFRGRIWPKGQDHYPPQKHARAMPQDSRDVWFPGVHGDIGGGYPDADSGLAKVPLHWMIEQTRSMGLLYDDRVIDAIVLGKSGGRGGPDAYAAMHNSMNWGWRLLEYLPRREPALSKRRPLLGTWQVPLSEPRFPPEGSILHRCILDRMEKGLDSPPNLPDDYSVEQWSPGYDPHDAD